MIDNDGPNTELIERVLWYAAFASLGFAASGLSGSPLRWETLFFICLSEFLAEDIAEEEETDWLKVAASAVAPIAAVTVEPSLDPGFAVLVVLAVWAINVYIYLREEAD
jgi:hypothetical protein